ncbi:CAP domain-containing protein [Actinosynnema sp. NPDC020468]|uniref:CAP domain-containing protein n=1 Tax=Actinosynnema sp. NPDC020468 TaxID=3154488 RepID=UPI0033ED4133
MNTTRIATAVLATGLATAAFLGTSAAANAATTPATAASYEAQVLTLTNQERAKVGCAALTANTQLATAAKAHNDEMAKTGTMTHAGVNGSTPATRIEAAGYVWKMAGENVAYGQKTPTQVMTDWMNSPAHKANLLNCGYKDLGVAYTTDAKGRAYWTQNFGSR